MDDILDRLNDVRNDLNSKIKAASVKSLNVDIKKFSGQEDCRDFEQFIREYCRIGDALDWEEDRLKIQKCD